MRDLNGKTKSTYQTEAAIVFFVASTGDDLWSGTLSEPNREATDGPFATIERARDAVRELKEESSLNFPVLIMVREGTYYFKRPFVLKPQDSGTEEQPIVYAAFPGEAPVLSGGKRIEGWTPTSGDLWQTEVPEAKSGKWLFRQLFVNGHRRTRARLPLNGGYYTIVDPVVPGVSDDPRNKSAFIFESGNLKNFPDLKNIEIVVLHRWDISRLKVSEVDEENKIVRLANSARWPFRRGLRYYLDNVREGLTEPGTWYLDYEQGMLYYHPLPGENMSSVDIVAPKINHLICLEGDLAQKKFIKNVCFRGFTLCHSDWVLPEGGVPGRQAAYDVSGTVSARGAINCAILDNEIKHIGTYGIEFRRGCKSNRIERNHIYDMGAGGIKIGEPENSSDDSDEASKNRIVDNTIHDGGEVSLGAVGIWIGQSGNNLVAHNEIFNMYYTGMSVGWNWSIGAPNRHKNNIIEYNHIHHVMRKTLSDGGGIYILGLSPGTVIRNNLIHDVYAYQDVSGRGIYLDQGSTGILVEKNVVYRTSGPLMRLQIAISSNIIQNNIFAFSQTSQLGFDTDWSNCFVQNIVYWKEGNLFHRDTWKRFDTIFDYNIYFNAGNEEIDFLTHTFDQWQKIERSGKYATEGMDFHSLIADPLFVNPEEGDFSLQPDSPAFKLGFEPIDLSSVGPRKHIPVTYCFRVHTPR